MDPSVIQQAIEAVNGGQWFVLAGLALMVLVWIARRALGEKKLPAAAVPVVNGVIAVAVAIADLLIGGKPWYEALAAGLLTGVAAGGFWSMIGKHVLPLPNKDAAGDGE